MHAVSACTSAGSTAGNIADPQLVAAQLAVGLDVDDPVRAQRRGDARRRRRPRRSRSCRRPASAWPGRRRTASRSAAALGPAVEVLGGGARARHAPVEAAAVEHPADLLGEQEQRGDRRRVVGLVLDASSRARSCSDRNARDPALGRRASSRDPLLRGRAEQRDPQPAVGAEALLRREVVGVGLRRRRPAARRRRRCASITTSASPAPAGRTHRRPSRRSRSRCAPRRARRRRPAAPGRPRRVGRVAGLGGDDDRVREERRAGA